MFGNGGMAAQRGSSTGYLAPGNLDEDEVLREARARAVEFGCTPVEPNEGATLRFLAAVVRAKAVVEIGTGVGVSGLWLLQGMTEDGVLTSIDIEPEHQRAARLAFRAAGYPSSRFRLINGMALDVLPRLADGAYDLVFIDGAIAEYPRYLDAALRLLRSGGVVALCGLLPEEELRRYPATDPDIRALREVLRVWREDERLVPMPTTGGLAIAAKAQP